MTQNEKFQIQRRTARRNFWQRQGGYSALPPKLLFIPLYLAGAVFVWSRQDAISAQVERMEISPDGEGQCTALLYHAKGADVQGEVFTRLHGAGYKIIQMGARSASLEDVFLSLLDRDKKQGKQPSKRKGGGKQ